MASNTMTVPEFLVHKAGKYQEDAAEISTFLRRVSVGVKEVEIPLRTQTYIENQVNWYCDTGAFGETYTFLRNPNTVNSFVAAINSGLK